jgi:hypothetical protein
LAHSPNITERRALAFGTASMCLAAFALVIWIKMRVVTANPRTGYAEPEKRFVEPARPFLEPSMEDSLGVRDVGVVPEHPTGIEPPYPN